MPKLILCLALLLIPIAVVADDPPAKASSNVVDKTVDLKFDSVPLGDAIAALFKSTNRSYTLDPALQQLRITAELKNVPFETAVSQVLKAAGAGYYVDDRGAYHISAQQQYNTMLQTQNAPAPPTVVAAPLAQAAGRVANNYQNVNNKIQVLGTKYISASQAAPIVQQIPGMAQVQSTSNGQLILNGTPEAIRDAVKAVDALDNASVLARAVRLKMSAKVTVTNAKGPKTYEASTESVGVEQASTLLNLEAQQTYYTNFNTVVRDRIVKQEQPNSLRLSLVDATITPSFIADNRIGLVGRGHFSCPLGSAPGNEISKDFDIMASVTPEKPYVLAAGSVNMALGHVDFVVTIVATPEEGRIPLPQNGYYNNAPASYNGGTHGSRSGYGGAPPMPGGNYGGYGTGGRNR